MRQVVSNTGVLDLDQFYLDATAVGAAQDKTLFEGELNALPTLVKNGAEMILAPGIYKNGKIYGFNGATKGLVEFDFSRASSGTYFDKNGILQTAASGMPRIDYDPVTKVCNGYLIESSSMNMLAWSNNFSNAITWVQRNTVTPNNVTAPNGNMEGSKITMDGTTAAHVRTNAITVEPGARYTFSFYVKKGTLNSYTTQFFNVTGNATMIETKVDYSSRVNSETWTRIENSVTIPAGCFEIFAFVKEFMPGEIGETFFLYGAQFEKCARATSYIPTAGAVSVRSGDSLQSASDVSPYRAGSYFMNFRGVTDNNWSTGYQYTSYFLNKLDLTYRIWAAYGVPASTCFAYEIGSDVIDCSASVNLSTFSKVLMSYSPQTIKINAKGQPVVSTISNGGFSNASGPLVFGTGATFIRMYAKSLAVFSRQLTDQEHIDITT